jgi:PIN domain nuclease of toxin-antitoxin system
VATTWNSRSSIPLRKIVLPNAPAEFVPRAMGEFGYLSLEIQLAHAIEVGQLPYFNRNPFDRMLIAQSRTEDPVLLTADDTLSRYDARILACGN